MCELPVAAANYKIWPPDILGTSCLGPSLYGNLARVRRMTAIQHPQSVLKGHHVNTSEDVNMIWLDELTVTLGTAFNNS